MAKIDLSVVINKPIEEVFPFVANIDNNPQWQSTVLEAKVTSSGPMDIGTTYRYVTQFLGKRFDMTGEITEYEQNKKYSFKNTSGPIPMEGSFILEVDEKGTRVTMVIVANISGYFKLAEPIVIRMFRRQLEADLANLKDLLEVQAQSSA